MQRSFAFLMPACEAKQRYSKLKQTGSAREYVRDMMQVVVSCRGLFRPGILVFDELHALQMHACSLNGAVLVNT